LTSMMEIVSITASPHTNSNPTLHYADPDRGIVLHHGDSIEVLATLPDSSVDSVVTDPPYGLSFMGKEWDTPGTMKGQMATGKEQRGIYAYGGTHDRGYFDHDSRKFQQWSAVWAAQCLRVLKPGGHLLSFGGTRTWHRLAAAIEDAGFEIRDSIAWLYGSGFPKSRDISKDMDRMAGAEREVLSTGRPVKRMIPGADQNATGSWIKDNGREFVPTQTVPATADATRWSGWGTALKPAFEPIIVARKPLIGTVAANVLTHGTGALNIDATRIGNADDEPRPLRVSDYKPIDGDVYAGRMNGSLQGGSLAAGSTEQGRWPANVVLDESQARALDEQAPRTGAAGRASGPTLTGRSERGSMAGHFNGTDRIAPFHADTGGASRFFYCAKASKAERPSVDGAGHPTVKPLALTRWLLRLVTPPNGTVLDPFVGSGTTVEAAMLEGFGIIGIEREAAYLPLIRQRITRQTG
jgi:DNA modification methylase